MKPALLFVVALAACEETPAKMDEDLSVQLPMDMRKSDGGAVDDLLMPDMASLFCQQACTPPQACCVVQSGGGSTAMCTTQGGCPDGGVFAACIAPSQCSGTLPTCCVTVNLDDNPDLGSSATGAVAQCSAACQGGLNGTVFKTKLCENAGHCVGYMGNFGFGDEAFNGCCNSSRAPNVYFCAPTAYAGPDSYSCL